MPAPDDGTTSTERLVSLASLVNVALVLVGLVLVVIGVWAALGWEWGLVTIGAALLVVDRWPRQGGVA